VASYPVSRRFGSAPCSSSSRIIVRLPRSAASCSGALQRPGLTSNLSSISSSTASRLSFSAASRADHGPVAQGAT
jgi:hypothetical protein